jgi:hypothetical protein
VVRMTVGRVYPVFDSIIPPGGGEGGLVVKQATDTLDKGLHRALYEVLVLVSGSSGLHVHPVCG